MRIIVYKLTFVLVILAVSTAAAQGQTPPKSVLGEMKVKSKNDGSVPNIVLIYADDLGYGDLSCYGATKIKTPNIDRLAKKGGLFTDGHSTSAVCTPSRHALLTGEYPLRINNYSPVFCEDSLLIDPEKTTIASLLKRKGYATACVGKWHLGFGNKRKPDWTRQLYNLKDDPYQKNNLIADDPERADEMAVLLTKMLSERFRETGKK